MRAPVCPPLQDDFEAHEELTKIIFGYKYVKWPNGEEQARGSVGGGGMDAHALLVPRDTRPLCGDLGLPAISEPLFTPHSQPPPPLPPPPLLPPPVRCSAGHLVDRKAFSLSGWCRLCAMLLSDIDFTLEDGMMHEGVGSA